MEVEENETRKKKQGNNVQTWGNATTMNINNMVYSNILASPYFKNSLFKLKTYHEVVDEIYYKVDHLEPWEKGSRKTSGQVGMCGGVRGVGAGGIVSSSYCLLFKLFTLKLTRKQLKGLLDHPDSPYIRGIGFMYVRYCLQPKDIWFWVEPYLEDEEEIDVKAGTGCTMTIGQMVRSFLLKLEWHGTLFPRIPVPVEKDIRERLTNLNLCDDHKRKADEGWGEAERFARNSREEINRPSRRSRSKERDHEKAPRRSGSRERSRDRLSARSSEPDRSKERQRRRSRDREKSRERHQRRSEERHRSRDRHPRGSRERERSRDRHLKHNRERERSRDRRPKHHRERDRSRDRHPRRSRDRERSRDRQSAHSRHRGGSKERHRRKDIERERSRERKPTRSVERDRSQDRKSQKASKRDRSSDRNKRHSRGRDSSTERLVRKIYGGSSEEGQPEKRSRNEKCGEDENQCKDPAKINSAEEFNSIPKRENSSLSPDTRRRSPVEAKEEQNSANGESNREGKHHKNKKEKKHKKKKSKKKHSDGNE